MTLGSIFPGGAVDGWSGHVNLHIRQV